MGSRKCILQHKFFKCFFSIWLKRDETIIAAINLEPFLKLVSIIFYQFFIFHQMITLQKLWEMFLFHLKNSFCYQDIQFIVFLSSPLFLPVHHCFRGCLKINFEVCDIINCLIKNLITNFIWYLGKEKRYDIETLSNDRVLNKENLYGKIMQKMFTKS